MSIVMLTYNNYEKFFRAFHSMFDFFYMDEILEIIIMDNGSTQKPLLEFLAQIERNFSKLIVIYSPVNTGVARGRKILFREARGEFIISLDSDIMVLDSRYMVQAIQRNLKPLPLEGGKEKGLWMLGGSGGNHPYFPSVYIEYVVNQLPREKKNEYNMVDEVAGWCQCFRKKLLDKVSIDENFSPFWGEDADFCIQIKKLGGFSAIFGKGVVGHKFSTCRNGQNMEVMYCQWEKVLQKHMNFENMIDTKWYSKKYKTDIPLQHYFTKGIYQGLVAKPDFSKLEDMSLEQLVSFHMNTVVSSLSDRGEYNIFSSYQNEKESCIYVDPTGDCKDQKNYKVHETKIKIKRHPYILMLMCVVMLGKRKGIINIPEVLTLPDTKKNRKGIKKIIRLENLTFQKLPTSFDLETVYKIIEKDIFSNIFKSSLIVTQEYDNILSPEYSPVHIIPELFLRMYHKAKNQQDCKNINIVITDNELEHEDIKNMKGDIFLVSRMEYVEKLPPGISYYHRYNGNTENTLLMVTELLMISEQMYIIYDYDTLTVFDLTKYTVMEKLEEFYSRSYFQNMTMIKNNFSLFSFYIDELDNISSIYNMIKPNERKIIEGKNIDFGKTLEFNVSEKISISHIWTQKVTEDMISFDREDEKEADFPLLIKDHAI